MKFNESLLFAIWFPLTELELKCYQDPKLSSSESCFSPRNQYTSIIFLSFSSLFFAEFSFLYYHLITFPMLHNFAHLALSVILFSALEIYCSSKDSDANLWTHLPNTRL